MSWLLIIGLVFTGLVLASYIQWKLQDRNYKMGEFLFWNFPEQVLPRASEAPEDSAEVCDEPAPNKRSEPPPAALFFVRTAAGSGGVTGDLSRSAIGDRSMINEHSPAAPSRPSYGRTWNPPAGGR